MGRHSAVLVEEERHPLALGPVTDPRLFDRPLPPAPEPPTAALYDIGWFDALDESIEPVAPFPPVQVRGGIGEATEVLPLMAGRPTLLGPRRPAFVGNGFARPPQSTRSQMMPAPSRGRDTIVAAAAIAVVGVMSGAAVLLPSSTGAQAETAAKTSPTPASSMSSRTTQQTERAERNSNRYRITQTAVPSTPTTTPSTRPSTRRPTTTTSSSAASQRTATTTTPARTSTSSVAHRVFPAIPATLGSGVYALRDFLNQSSGTVVSGGVLKGLGIGRTVVQMTSGTSTRGGAVPGNGNNQGGLANPVNPLYLIRGVNRLEDVTVQGTAQGHLYNGVYMSGSNILIRNVEVNAIPGNSSANPGETFAVNVNRATGTNTVQNLTINGGSGALASAAGLAINNSDANWDISGLTTRNLRYSAGIALWQVRGTLDVHNYVQRGGARSLGAERLAGTVNLYDPVWDAGTTGHDITYTWDGGFSGGRIDFHYSSAANVPNRKIVVLTNKAAGVTGSVHVYIGGVLQPTSKYVTFV